VEKGRKVFFHAEGGGGPLRCRSVDSFFPLALRSHVGDDCQVIIRAGRRRRRRPCRSEGRRRESIPRRERDRRRLRYLLVCPLSITRFQCVNLKEGRLTICPMDDRRKGGFFLCPAPQSI